MNYDILLLILFVITYASAVIIIYIKESRYESSMEPNKDNMKPTPSQITYAKYIFKKTGIPMPKDKSYSSYFKYITENSSKCTREVINE